jgi:PAS domain S-box-containing protein
MNNTDTPLAAEPTSLPQSPKAGPLAPHWLAHPWLGSAVVFTVATLLLALPDPNLAMVLVSHLYFPVVALIGYLFGWRPALVAAMASAVLSVVLAERNGPVPTGNLTLFIVTYLVALSLLILLIAAMHQSQARAETLASELRDRERRLDLTLAAGSIGTFDAALQPDPADTLLQLWHRNLETLDRERLTALLCRRLEDRSREVRCEYRLLRADGSTRWLELRAQVRYSEDGQPQRIYGMTLDVSERHQAAEHLRQAEALFDKLFINAPFGVVQVTPESRILRVNPAVYAWLGYTREQIIGRSFLEFTHPDDRPGNRKGFSQLVSNQIPQYVTEKRFLAADGRAIWARVIGNLVGNDEGEPLYSIAIIMPMEWPAELG